MWNSFGKKLAKFICEQMSNITNENSSYHTCTEYLTGDAISYEPVHGKTNEFGFPTRSDTNRLYSYRRKLEA